MHALQPLVDKAELVEQSHRALQDILDQCDHFLRTEVVKPCPCCGRGNLVKVTPWTPPNPEHDDTAIVIQCDNCAIQTKPQYWFVSTPESALTALQAAYQHWNTRPLEKELP